MKSRFNLSTKATILQALVLCRQQTLTLFADLNRDLFIQQFHPDFSPIGWHLGHIAFTEAYWILEYLGQYPPLFPEYHQLFAADGLAKVARQNLPPLKTIKEYLAIVRSKVLNYLEAESTGEQERLWWWLIQHESQHNETISLVWQLSKVNSHNFYREKPSKQTETSTINFDMVSIEAGEFIRGNDEIQAHDNERPKHQLYLASYAIDRYPVTCQQYQEFMLADGYKNPHYWSKEGWQWLQNNSVSQPLYWQNSSAWQQHPVCGVNYYEAEAYANFVGKRLPTEAEWEKAAQFEIMVLKNWQQKQLAALNNQNNQLFNTVPVNADSETESIWGCYSMLGNVWEWTASWFSGYQGFKHYLYPGYSQVYFDRQHRVLKGGSWATLPWALRSSFRNWYHPWVREIFAGFRCAKSC
ncbi:MAG TPA: SUMF1/EgtB/PvdO family nonheme iron enzyme [Xenococcaceae cyanobacterium]